MATNSYPENAHMNTGQMPISQEAVYPNSAHFTPWTTAGYPYPVMSSASDAEHGGSWSYSVPSTYDGPSMFGSTSTIFDLSSHEPMPTTAAWSPSVNPHSTSGYSTAAFPFPAEGQHPEPTVWGSSEHAPSSLYSYAPTTVGHPPLTRSISADNGLSAYSMGLSDPASPASDAASSSTLPAQPQPKKRNNSKSATKAAKKSDSKLRPNSPATRPKPNRANSNITELHYQNQLRARFGDRMSAIPPNQDPSATVEQIRREAWRICRAEALEMSQRRMRLLEHEHGALERETQQLQVNIKLMRDAVAREQAGLEDAVERAEMLSSSY